MFDIDFTCSDLVWDDDLELAVKHPRRYANKLHLDILDSTTDNRIVLNAANEQDQNKTDSLANRDLDKTGLVSNAQDMRENLPKCSRLSILNSL